MATGKKRRVNSRDGLYKRDGSRHYWTRIPGEGRVSTQTEDREAARIWRARKLREAADPCHAASVRTTVTDMIAQALDAHRVRRGRLGGRVTEKTMLFYAQKLGHFARIFGSDRPLIELDYDLFGVYIAQRETEPGSRAGSLVSPATIGKELKEARFALRLQRGRGAYPHDVDFVTRKGEFSDAGKECERSLSWPEICALIVAFGDYGKQAGTLSPKHEAHQAMRAQQVAWHIAVGVRMSESEHAELKDHVSTVVDGEVRWRVLVRGTKSKKAKGWVPIAPAFHRLLEWSLYGRPKVGRLFRPWSNFNRALLRACERAGIDRCSTNDLRRTHMTLLSNAGVSHEDLKIVSRHSTTAMLDKHYAKRSVDAAERALSRVGWGAEEIN